MEIEIRKTFFANSIKIESFYVLFCDEFSIIKDITGKCEIQIGDKNYSYLKIILQGNNIILESDYIGSYQLFLYQSLDCVLSSNFYPNQTDLNLESVYDYILNGIVHSHFTTSKSIITSTADSLSLFDGSKWKVNDLYSLNFGKSKTSTKYNLKQEMLISIKDCLLDEKDNVISLSGGMDSAAILYGSLNYDKNLKAITYSNSLRGSNSDSDFAVRRADEANVPVLNLKTDNISLYELCRLNSRLGAGKGKWCDEIGIFTDPYFNTPNKKNLLVGDTYFLPKVEFNSLSELFDIVGYSSSQISNNFIKSLFKKEVFKNYLKIRESCIENINYKNKEDLRDFVYWKYRLSTTLMWWRFRIQGRYVKIKIPFLKKTIFDYFIGLKPIERDNDRSIYKSAINEIDERVFSQGRAKKHGVPPDYRKLLNSEITQFIDWVNKSESSLDDFISKKDFIKILNLNNEFQNINFLNILYSLRQRVKSINTLCRILNIPSKPYSKLIRYKLRLIVLRMSYEK